MIKASIPGDETTALVGECTAIVEGGRVTGVRAVIKFVRPLSAAGGLLLAIDDEHFGAEVPAVAPPPKPIAPPEAVKP